LTDGHSLPALRWERNLKSYFILLTVYEKIDFFVNFEFSTVV